MSDLVGKMAPDFTAQDQDGKTVALKNFQGRYVLLYFYPKDMTPGCTTEAKTFRDKMEELKDLGVVVLGVSKDSVESHKKFEEKHQLNFRLLADTEKKIIENYGVWAEKSMFGKKYMGIARDSFLIDPSGKVVKHYKKVKPAQHPEEVIKDVKELK